jgi:methylglutaconyl-CoA hydratase
MPLQRHPEAAMSTLTQARAVEVHHDGGRFTICLNRPERHNAFDADVIADLTDAFERAGQHEAARVVVLSAKGGTFCAGADLRWMRSMADQGLAANQRDAEQLAQLLWTIHHCPLPVVAQVQGDCLGGGVGLVAAADIALASGHAHFALSEVRLGLIPATISPYLVQAMGHRHATRYALTAERFDADTAWRCGLVHEVLAPLELPERVDEIVHQMMQNGPQALRRCKALMRHVAQHPLDEALRDETARRIAETRASPEGQAGMTAFLSRQRQPWQ